MKTEAKLHNENKSRQKKPEKNGTKEEIKISNEDQSYWEMMINGIVRPPRAKYHEAQLGSKVVCYKGKMFLRDDHQLDHKGKKLDLTIYLESNRGPFVILYMHGNSSCRVEALGLIRHIPEKISLASFDFMGCGKNQEEDTISLGYREADQANTVMEYLKKLGFRVIIWGRSMGAATALLYGKAEFIVADSSFKSFKSLCKQVAKEYSPKIVPNCMITCFFPCVFSKLKKDVDRKAKYDVDDLDVREAVKNLHPKTVVVFMSGDKDNLINVRNSQKLFNICPCEEKYIKVFQGDHNSKRPDTVMIEVMEILQFYAQRNNDSSANRIVEEEIVLRV